MSGQVWVRLQLVGWHRWPAATGHRSYLAHTHRHLFGVTVTIPAAVDNQRAVEFHDLMDLVRELWPRAGQWQDSSCETIASLIGRELVYQLAGVPWVTVAVDEDGEAGATITTERQP